jgi:hypothetical protein
LRKERDREEKAENISNKIAELVKIEFVLTLLLDPGVNNEARPPGIPRPLGVCSTPSVFLFCWSVQREPLPYALPKIIGVEGLDKYTCKTRVQGKQNNKAWREGGKQNERDM